MIYLRINSAGVRLVGSLKASLSATFLLVLPTTLRQNFLNNLHAAATCLSLEAVSIFACIYSFVMCASFMTPTNFQCAFFFFTARSPRIFKHVLRQYDSTEWHCPLFPEFRTSATRMHSFNAWPHSTQQSAKSLSDARFFLTGKHFQHKCVYYRKKQFLKNQLMQKLFFFTGSRHLFSCFHCGQTQGAWEEIVSSSQLHTHYTPKFIYLPHVNGLQFRQCYKTLSVTCFSTASVMW